MDKSRFWQMIDDARAEAAPSDDIAPVLTLRLAALDVSDIMRWQQLFTAYQRLSYKNKLWAAAYTINGGCSDDGFDYFRGWLTAQGKAVFMQALADPDSLADVDVEMDEAFYEDMLGLGYMAYFKKMNMTQRDYTKFRAEYDAHPLSDDELREIAAEIHYAEDINTDWDEDDLASVVPRLSEKFG